MSNITNPVTNDAVRKIIAEILYIDDINVIKNNTSIFLELDLSSVDYIDLCFELRKSFGKKFYPNELWPFNKMTTNPEYFINNEWTPEGWKKVCVVLNIDSSIKPELIRDLYKRFTVDYIVSRLGLI